jgi:CRP-like cAMP-binding protein
MSTDLVGVLQGMSLFADLSRAQLEEVSHTFEEEVFEPEQRVMRRGLSGSSFYVIVDGEATVLVEGRQIGTMGRGEFFGEISVLLDIPPSADVVAKHELRCISLPATALREFLLRHPPVALRMLQVQAQRLHDNTEWLGS